MHMLEVPVPTKCFIQFYNSITNDDWGHNYRQGVKSDFIHNNFVGENNQLLFRSCRLCFDC